MKTSTLLVIALSVGPLCADDFTFSRILLPVAVHDLPGALGSVWTTETWLHSSAGEAVVIYPTPACGGITCGTGGVLEPRISVFGTNYGVTPHGLLVYLSQAGADHIHFSHRLRDLSRNADTAGTAMPVVPESRILNQPVQLLNVPVELGFRHTLRVYALPQETTPQVRVEFFKMKRAGFDEILASRDLVLSPSLPEQFQFRPAYAEVGSLMESIGTVQFGTPVRVVITPLDRSRIWAFISVTDNETQQVTIIAPME